ncbi:MAG: hypothetical protein ABL888_07110 [Pirellulaceae bacterium]
MINCICVLAMIAMSSVETTWQVRPTDEKYLVVSLVDESSEFLAAAEMLAERHDAKIVNAAPGFDDKLLTELQRLRPTTVAFVVHPNDLDINLVQKILVLSTRIDADPFVDFAYGFITGRNGEAAVRLVKASEKALVEPAITMFGVGSAQMGKSFVQKAAWPLRGATIPMTTFYSAGDSDETRDEKFVGDAMAKISKPPILLLASHGYPNGLVGGPKASDLRGVDLSGSVVLNIACYNGVTCTWYVDDWGTMKVAKKSVTPEESLCLQVIDSGVAGYVAWTCPRPAGPTMMGEAMLVASTGQSLGELRRSDANSVVLAHLLSGESAVKADPMVEGTELKGGQTAGQAVRKMSTGGVLIGDPAFIPFAEKPDTDPRTVEVTEKPDGLVVNAKVQTPLFHFFAGEQVNYWNDNEAAMRLETVVPLGDRVVSDVQLAKAPAGVTEYKLVAAVEHDRGKRFLKMKITFAQPKDMMKLQAMSLKGLSGQFELTTSKGPASSEQDARIFRRDSKK